MNFLRLSYRLPCPILARPLSVSPVICSGSNKWSKIKHKKGANDLQKSAIYGRASLDIRIAIRQGGSGNPETNTILAAVLKKAKSQGVPKDSLDSFLKNAIAKNNSSNTQAITYEAMCGTIGVMIESLTDNPTRTLLKLRGSFTKKGARFAPVAFMFQRQGIVRVSLEQGEDFSARLERLIETALEAEAEDFEQREPSEGAVEIEFKCQPTSISSLTAAVTAPGLCKELLGSELIYAPVDPAEPPDEETATKLSELVEDLEEHEDILRVWTSVD